MSEQQTTNASNASNSEDNNALALLNQHNVPATSKEESKDLSAMAQASWIPSLAVAYGTSDMVKEKKAYPGDFTLGGQTNLGSTINVVTLDYRLRASEFNLNTKKFGSSVYHFPKNGALRDNKEYNDFIKRLQSDKNVECQDGAEFLFYIPNQNTFGVFFCKKTLKNAIDPIYRCGIGRLITLSTKMVHGRKNDYYVVDVIATDKVVKGSTLQLPGVTLKPEVDIAADQLLRNFKLFLKPSQGDGVADETTEDLND